MENKMGLFKIGDYSKQVKEIQERLGLNVDGIFGPNTKKAVIEFQKENGLTPDGIVGKNTWKHLLKEEDNKVEPICDICDDYEDESDPDEQITICTSDEADVETKTSPYIAELINLINSTEITRNIKRLIFHCTATDQDAKVASIQNYWKNNLGWTNPGYHIIVKPDGSWTYLLDFNKVSNGVRGYNSTSINISYIGGVDENGKALDNRTDEQIEVFDIIYEMLTDKIEDITVHGHNEFASKACPSYIVQTDLESRGLV